MIRLVGIALLLGGCARDSVESARARASCDVQPGELVISEVMANPLGNDDGKEYVEVHNPSGRDLDLGGVELTAEGKRVAVGGERAAVDAYVVLATADLKNGGGALALRCDGVELAAAAYPVAEQGRAWSRDGDAFCAADGTPGAPNAPCPRAPRPGECDDGGVLRVVVHPQRGDLIINEVMADPAAVADSAGEWMELFAARAVDLNGVVVSRTAGAGLQSVTLGSATCLRVAAGGHVLLARNDEPAQNGGLPPVLARLGSLSLLNGKGDLFVESEGVRLDEVSWPNTEAGAAHALDPAHIDALANDDRAHWSTCAARYGDGDGGTPGASNTGCTP